MNFTAKVKQELEQIISSPRHCRIAEFAAITAFMGKICGSDNHLEIFSENVLVIKKVEKLIKKIFFVDNIGEIIYDIKRSGKETGKIIFSGQETKDILGLLKTDGSLQVSQVLYTMTCCKRAYFRGAFLAIGTLTDPNKDYHLELSCPNMTIAENLKQLISSFDVETKIAERKGRYVIYVKDSEKISEMLGLLGAQNAMMELENVRIYKDVMNKVNRQVNCDAANIKKALRASEKQLEDIRFIREKTGFKGISEDLVRTAALREQYPEATLSELVMYNGGTVGKSGINHRLKKLSEIAEKLRS